MANRGGPQGSPRDPELGFEVVYSSRSKQTCEVAAERLRRDHHKVLTGLDEHRTRHGWMVREHQVLVPYGQRDRALKLIASAPIRVDDRPAASASSELRRRLGDRAFEGATTVAWIFGALIVVAVALVILAG